MRDEQGTGVTATMARFIAEAGFEDLPEPVVEQTKIFILDVLGNSFGGITSDIGQIALKIASKLGGNPHAHILGTSIVTSVLSASYVNAKSANALDFDDAHLNFLHIGPTTVPAALAVGEMQHCSGKDLVTAVAFAYDIAARIGLSMGMPFIVDQEGNFQSGDVQGTSWKVFGAAVAAAKLLRLDVDGVVETFGIAGANAPMPAMKKWEFEEARPLPLQKSIDVGWVSQAGVLAALLAQSGSTGYRTILEGQHGFWRMSGARGCNFDLMIDELGTKWHILEAGIKPYPSCRHMHVALDLFRTIRDKYQLGSDQIEKVVCKVSPMSVRPVWMNQGPRNLVESEFSIPHSIAMLAYRIPPGPAWHAPEQIDNDAVKEFRKRVFVGLEPKAKQAMMEQYPSFYRRLPATVEVHLTSGRVLVESADNALGDCWVPEYRTTMEQAIEKFMANGCGILASSSIWRAQLQAAAEAIFSLEDMDDIYEIGELLTPF
ncbi:MAG: MmgE/PrpD family protein [Clostridia bacterium]|nr:MAG: MmgE/PrpD family protein [Clostridia bacterium]